MACTARACGARSAAGAAGAGKVWGKLRFAMRVARAGGAVRMAKYTRHVIRVQQSPGGKVRSGG